MRVADFDYHLPEDRIALRPAQPRDSARLLLSAETISDHHVYDLPQLLRAGDLLVFNDTKVIPARLFGKRGEAKIELMLHHQLPTVHPRERGDPEGASLDSRMRGNEEAAGGVWDVFARPAKKLKPDDVVIIADDFFATILGRNEDGTVRLRFNKAGEEMFAALHQHGHMPLPPYIKREDDTADRGDYQTLFAAREGAVAAPTASLHYTPELLQALAAAGIGHTTVTLHVGAGTFLPVKVDDTKDHIMHAEWCEITPATVQAIRDTKAKGGRVIAVGTTALRTLESAAHSGELQPFSGETRLFITPGYTFRVVDGLLTNFHLPQSTLLMLVAAFVGMERMKAIYAHAIAQNYRFYSYGDTSLLFPAR